MSNSRFPFFSEHGSSEILVENNILVLRVKGPWNIEFFQQFHTKLVEAASVIAPHPHAAVLIPQGEAIALPDAGEFHIEFLKQVSTKAIAIVLEECQTKSLTIRMLDNFYQSAKIPHEYFDNINLARDWLENNYLSIH